MTDWTVRLDMQLPGARDLIDASVTYLDALSEVAGVHGAVTSVDLVAGTVGAIFTVEAIDFTTALAHVSEWSAVAFGHADFRSFKIVRAEIEQDLETEPQPERELLYAS